MSVGQGYPDFTRLSQFTSAPILNVNANANNVATRFGPFYVGGFESLQVHVPNLTGVGFTFLFSWWGDAAATIAISNMTYQSFRPIVVHDIVPNRGPYMTVDVAANSAAPQAYHLIVVPRTGTPIGGSARGDGIIVSATGVVIGAGGNSIALPDLVATGPAVLTITGGTTLWQAQVQAINEFGGTEAVVGALDGGNSVGAASQLIHLPPYPCQVQTFNTSGAGATFNAAVVLEL